MEFLTFIIILILILCCCTLFFGGDGLFTIKNTDNSVNSLIILSNNDKSIDNNSINNKSIDDYI
jgi:hypothetical protein